MLTFHDNSAHVLRFAAQHPITSPSGGSDWHGAEMKLSRNEAFLNESISRSSARFGAG